MWPIVGILLIGGIIAGIEIPSMKKKKNYKEMFVFLILLISGLSLGILAIIGIELPTPLYLISKIFKPVSDLLQNYVFS
jgi:hypothetical protein